jgi:anti-sigma B factor antagonist
MHETFEVISGEVQGRTAILRVRGRLDARSAPELLQAGTDVQNRNQHLVLDLSGVTFMASSGLGSLLSLAEEYRRSECHLRIVAPSGAVTSVVQLLNLEEFLAIVPSETEALLELEA